MTTPDDPRTSICEESLDKRIGEPSQSVGRVAECTATERTTAPHADEESLRSRGAPLGDAYGFAALEDDFRSHHHTMPARRHSPYKYYRVVYRYGYDLGVDVRYRSAEWSDVEQVARPHWEERNPNTWAEFQDMIHYAWDAARSRR